MIDFHTHMLPFMDDGSKSVSESLYMLRTSYEMGVDTMVSTPHYYSFHEDISSFINRRARQKGILMQQLAWENAVPNIVLGAEVTFFYGMSRERGVHKLCIENTDAMLLEMPFSEWSSLTLKEIKSLITLQGITPILAHVERYFPYLLQKNMLDQLIGLGVLLQTNGEALICSPQKHKVLKLLCAEKIHLLGSDCHNMSSRPPNLRSATDVIIKELGGSVLQRMDQAGQCILHANLPAFYDR